MPKKRRNNGRSRTNGGGSLPIQCTNCERCVGKVMKFCLIFLGQGNQKIPGKEYGGRFSKEGYFRC